MERPRWSGAAAACRSLCHPPFPPRGWAGDTPGVAQGGPGCLGHLLYGSIPGRCRRVWKRSRGTGDPALCQAVPALCPGPMAPQVSHLWSWCPELACTGAGDLGRGRMQEKSKLWKKPPTPKKSKQTHNCLSSREKTSTFLKNLPLYLTGKNFNIVGFVMLPQMKDSPW